MKAAWEARENPTGPNVYVVDYFGDKTIEKSTGMTHFLEPYHQGHESYTLVFGNDAVDGYSVNVKISAESNQESVIA